MFSRRVRIEQLIDTGALAAPTMHRDERSVCMTPLIDSSSGLCLKGKTLQDTLESGNKIPLRTIIKIIVHVCEDLENLHASGKVVGDLNPGKIVFAKKDNCQSFTARIKKGGYSISGKIQSSVPHCGAPEQLDPQKGQEWDERTDIYGLGSIMYKAIYGHYISEAGEEKYDDLHIPVDVNDILIRALETDPDKRFQTAKEMKEALVRYYYGEKIEENVEPPQAKVQAKVGGPEIFFDLIDEQEPKNTIDVVDANKEDSAEGLGAEKTVGRNPDDKPDLRAYLGNLIVAMIALILTLPIQNNRKDQKLGYVEEARISESADYGATKTETAKSSDPKSQTTGGSKPKEKIDIVIRPQNPEDLTVKFSTNRIGPWKFYGKITDKKPLKGKLFKGKDPICFRAEADKNLRMEVTEFCVVPNANVDRILEPLEKLTERELRRNGLAKLSED